MQDQRDRVNFSPALIFCLTGTKSMINLSVKGKPKSTTIGTNKEGFLYARDDSKHAWGLWIMGKKW